MPGKDYGKICLECLPEIKKTGLFIKNELGAVTTRDIETKSLNSLVTYVDRTAEEQLVTSLKKILPSAGFITEEETVAQGGKEVEWIIDPLDGTNNFLHGIPHFAISVGLKVGENLVAGIVYEVNSGECYYAWENGGAYLNGKPIKVSRVPALDQSILATGFPYAVEDPGPLIDTLAHFIKNARGIRRFGAAALDLAYVACGRFDVYYETTLNAWDVAAGALLVKEAGGRVSDFNLGENYLFGGQLIASNGLLHGSVQKVIASKFPLS